MKDKGTPPNPFRPMYKDLPKWPLVVIVAVFLGWTFLFFSVWTGLLGR